MNSNPNADNPYANAWRDEYYPIRARVCPRGDALDHSILKWTGLQKGVIEKIGYYPIEVNSITCALCVHHQGDGCTTCPIKIVNRRTCDREWRYWVNKEDPAPMLALLKATKRNIEMNEAKTPTLELSENHEYRTRGGRRAFYVDRELKGEEPHLFIVENGDGDGADVPITINRNLSYLTEGQSDYDIVGYYANWPEVPVDTKILVRDHASNEWVPAYFSRYDHQMVYAFWNGRTSFSVNSPSLTNQVKDTAWAFAKLVD